MYGIDQMRASRIMLSVNRKTFDKQSVIFLYCISLTLKFMTVYLIEDDEIYAEFVQRSLSKNPNFKIKAFKSAEDCLQHGNGSADAYIVDYRLPGKSGIEFYEEIKPRLKEENKLIMMSAIDDGNMVLSFIKKGVRDYVIKDDNVIESLTAILEGKEEDYYLFG